MASDRRCRQTRLEVELAAALSTLAAARREEGESRGVAEQLRAEAGEASARCGGAGGQLARYFCRMKSMGLKNVSLTECYIE